jgi:hypothetical protein
MAKPGTRKPKPARLARTVWSIERTGVTMSPIPKNLKLIAAAIGVCALSACASLDTASTSLTPAAKVDSGLGELPHYRNWADPSGRAPMAHVVTAADVTSAH